MLNYVDLNVCSHFVTGNVNARYAIKASQPFFFFLLRFGGLFEAKKHNKTMAGDALIS